MAQTLSQVSNFDQSRIWVMAYMSIFRFCSSLVMFGNGLTMKAPPQQKLLHYCSSLEQEEKDAEIKRIK